MSFYQQALSAHVISYVVYSYTNYLVLEAITIDDLYITITLHIIVGQCGNQIGGRFWDLALRETLFYKKVNLIYFIFYEVILI